jgi:hypothetical protein
MKLITLSTAHKSWKYIKRFYTRWDFGPYCDYLRGHGFIIY